MALFWTTRPVRLEAKAHPETGQWGTLITAEFEEVPDKPPVDPDQPPNGAIGCDPRVKSGTFPLDGYAVPDVRYPIVTLEDFGGSKNRDCTDALKRALQKIKDGGTLQLGPGYYGLHGSNKFKSLKNVTIKGNGRGSGFYALDQEFIGEWRALMEFQKCSDLWVDHLEFNMRNQRIGCIRYSETTDPLFSRLYCYDIGGGMVGGRRHAPLAAIKGSEWSKNHREIGNFLPGRGDETPDTGSRGTWGPQQGDGFDGGLWENIWVEGFGHTQLVPNCGRGKPFYVRHCTSIGSGGAACKAETPDNLRAKGDQQQANVWWPDEPKVIIEYCELRDSAYHAVQAEQVGTRISNCILSGCTNGVGTFDRLLTLEIVDNVITDNSHAGIWCSQDQGQIFGRLKFEGNKITGNHSKAGIGFDPRCKRPEQHIIITGNEGVDPLVLTEQIRDHPDTIINNNKP